MSAGPLLHEIKSLLDASGIAHMVVGSFASTTHGRPRSTLDLDLVIDPTRDQLDAFLAALDLDRFYVDTDTARDALARRGMFNIIDMRSAWKLDLVIRKARPFSISELGRRAQHVIDGVAIDVATAEDTILAKLEWAVAAGGSERQLRDVAGILELRTATLDFAYIERWARELGLVDVWMKAEQLARTGST